MFVVFNDPEEKCSLCFICLFISFINPRRLHLLHTHRRVPTRLLIRLAMSFISSQCNDHVSDFLQTKTKRETAGSGVYAVLLLSRLLKIYTLSFRDEQLIDQENSHSVCECKKKISNQYCGVEEEVKHGETLSSDLCSGRVSKCVAQKHADLFSWRVYSLMKM